MCFLVYESPNLGIFIRYYINRNRKGYGMSLKGSIYQFFVNRHIGIAQRYHRVHDRASGAARLLSWVLLLWWNFAYYILFCHFLGEKKCAEIYEEKRLLVATPESAMGERLSVEQLVEELCCYDVTSFDIFDIILPFGAVLRIFEKRELFFGLFRLIFLAVSLTKSEKLPFRLIGEAFYPFSVGSPFFLGIFVAVNVFINIPLVNYPVNRQAFLLQLSCNKLLKEHIDNRQHGNCKQHTRKAEKSAADDDTNQYPYRGNADSVALNKGKP